MVTPYAFIVLKTNIRYCYTSWFETRCRTSASPTIPLIEEATDLLEKGID